VRVIVEFQGRGDYMNAWLVSIFGVLRRVTSPPSAFDSDCLEHFEGAGRKYEARLVIYLI